VAYLAFFFQGADSKSFIHKLKVGLPNMSKLHIIITAPSQLPTQLIMFVYLLIKLLTLLNILLEPEFMINMKILYKL